MKKLLATEIKIFNTYGALIGFWSYVSTLEMCWGFVVILQKNESKQFITEIYDIGIFPR